jgi:hypothetical protein
VTKRQTAASIKRQSASVEKTAAPICAACNVTASLSPARENIFLKMKFADRHFSILLQGCL